MPRFSPCLSKKDFCTSLSVSDGIIYLHVWLSGCLFRDLSRRGNHPGSCGFRGAQGILVSTRGDPYGLLGHPLRGSALFHPWTLAREADVGEAKVLGKESGEGPAPVRSIQHLPHPHFSILVWATNGNSLCCRHELRAFGQIRGAQRNRRRSLGDRGGDWRVSLRECP